MGELEGEHLEALRCRFSYVYSCIKNRNAFTFKTYPACCHGLPVENTGLALRETCRVCRDSIRPFVVYSSFLEDLLGTRSQVT